MRKVPLYSRLVAVATASRITTRGGDVRFCPPIFRAPTLLVAWQASRVCALQHACKLSAQVRWRRGSSLARPSRKQMHGGHVSFGP